MDRFSRLLGAKKQDRIKSSNRMPTRGDGNDGDMMVVNGSLLIKDRGLWLKFAANIETSDGEGTVNATTVTTNTIQEVNVPHTVSSHTDTSVTGSQLTTLTSGAITTLHSHNLVSHTLTDHTDVGTVTGTGTTVVMDTSPLIETADLNTPDIDGGTLMVLLLELLQLQLLQVQQ